MRRNLLRKLGRSVRPRLSFSDRSIHRPLVRHRRLTLEPLEDRRLLSVFTQDLDIVRDEIAVSGSVTGATIITHGYHINGNSLMPLAEEIHKNAPGTLIDCFVIGDGSEEWFQVDRTDPSTAGKNEVVILFDWAAGSNEKSFGWGEAAGDALFSTLVGLDLVNPGLGTVAGLLHFIGHSMGCAVTSEVIERLAAFEIPVDHVTYLDPHDFDQDLSLLVIHFNETEQQLWRLGRPDNFGVTVWDNVTFADVYYQTTEELLDGTIPEGRPIPGAYNDWLEPDELPGFNDHTLVWSQFYAGTVEDPLSDASGYRFSRLAGQVFRPDAIFFDSSQDHEHSEEWLVNRTTGNANPQGLAELGMTASQVESVRWNPEYDPGAIVNGTFVDAGRRLEPWEPGFPDLSTVPGWSNHAGRCNAEIADGKAHLGEYGLTNFTSLQHNRLYFPANAHSLLFDYWIEESSTDDKLEVYFGSDRVAFLDLSEKGIHFGSIDLGATRNTVDTVEFRLNPHNWGIGSDVYIDNVRFLMPSPAQESVEAGIDWLLTQQDQTNGSWSNDAAHTSMAVLAMLNAGYAESDAAVANGIQYILTQIHGDGSVGHQSSRYTYRTAIAILPLVATHNADYHDEIQKMRSWLINAQWTSGNDAGGFGYGSGGRADLSNTQWALMGLKAADRELDLNASTTYTRALSYLDRCRNADGGSGYYPGHSFGSIHTMTAASVWSYRLCDVPQTDPRVAGGIQWLADHYSVTNNDGWGQSAEYYYKVTFAKSLVMSHKTTLGGNDWFNDLAGALMSEQQEGGSWPYAEFGGQELSTAWAILALQTRTLPLGADVAMAMILKSHADVHVYVGVNHLGIDYETGTLEREIPGADLKYFEDVDTNGNGVPDTTEQRYLGDVPDDPATWHRDIPTEWYQVVSLSQLVAGSYRIELLGTSAGDYDFTIEGLQDGAVVTSEDFAGSVEEGDRLATSVTVTAMEGALTLLYEDLVETPVMELSPSELLVYADPGSSGSATFDVLEVGGEYTLHSVSPRCSDLVGPAGTIDGDLVTFDVNDFDVNPGASQTVNVTIPVPAGFTGMATGTIIVESTDGGTKSIDLTVDASPVVVTAFSPTASGFAVEFSEAIDPSVLNLYDVQSGFFGVADILLVGDTAGPIPGSLVVEDTQVTFVATGGPLPVDTYTVTLRSAEDAFKDLEFGQLLDGEYTSTFPSGDGTPGGDFVYTFTVDAVAATQEVVVAGGSIHWPTGIAVDAAGDIYVTSYDFLSGPDPPAYGWIVKVDAETGEQTVISEAGHLVAPEQIVIDHAGDLLVVNGHAVGVFPPHVVRIDPATGTQTILSEGGSIHWPSGIAVDAAGNIYVTSYDFLPGPDPPAYGWIVKVDPETGEQTVISEGGHLVAPKQIAVDHAGLLLVANYENVVRIDPATGTQTIVSDGGSIHWPSGIAVDPAGDIYVTSYDFLPQPDPPAYGWIVKVDPETGEQTVISEGGHLVAPEQIVIDHAGDLLVVNGHAVGVFPPHVVRIGAAIDRVVSLPDFARGPGQEVDIPVAEVGGEGIPITINNADGVTSGYMKVKYDPDLLTITGAVLGPGAPEGSMVSVNLDTPGEATLAFFSLTPLWSGPAEIITLDACVPTDAPYGAAHVLDITDLELNAGALAATDDDALHVVAFLGDVNPNPPYDLSDPDWPNHDVYDTEDPRLIARVGMGFDSGFEHYPTIDPMILGDVTGDGTLSPLDSSHIMEEVVGMDSEYIPPLPVMENAVPMADEQEVTTDEDTAVLIQLTGDDGDCEVEQTLTFALVDQPAHGNVEIDSVTGLATYTPEDDYNDNHPDGEVTFTFTVTDDDQAGPTENLTSLPAMVTITVNPVNDRPTADPQNVTVPEDTATLITLIGNDKDPEVTQVLTFVITDQPDHGTLTPPNQATGKVTYTPFGGYVGLDSFAFMVVDDNQAGTPPGLMSAEATVSITVENVNDAPVLDNSGDAALAAIDEDDTANAGTSVTDLIASVAPLDMITDPDAGAQEGIAVTAVDSTNGQWEYSTDNGGTWSSLAGVTETSARLLAADGSTRMRFAPNAHFNGVVGTGVTLRGWDQTTGLNGDTADVTSNGGTTAFSLDIETASITIDPINDRPTADPQNLTTPQDTPLPITLTGDDGDPEVSQNLTYAIDELPQHGDLSDLVLGRELTYTPHPGYVGSDSFAFLVIDDGQAGPPANRSSQPATISIIVGSPLLAAGGDAPNSAVAAPLREEEVLPIVDAALARWAAAGLAAEMIDAMAAARFVITDLSGTQLGLATIDTIYVDHDAAGRGWFVDPTPSRDEEFARIGAESDLQAIDWRAIDRMDLLSVVEHELGHLVGLEDLDSLDSGLMTGTLEEGVRRTPTSKEVEAVFAAGDFLM